MTQFEYETCYVFDPQLEISSNTQPTKKRKIAKPQGLHTSWPQRRDLYSRSWSSHENRLRNSLKELDQQIVSDISNFIHSAPCDKKNPKIDSAIIVSGPSLVSQSELTDKLQSALHTSSRSCFITIASVEATNLKAVLKRVNAVASSADYKDDDDEADDQVSSGRRGTRLLNYDLRILQQVVEDQSLSKVVVAFQDCEAFDGSLLSDLIDLFSCWKDRIPFVLLFGIATSIDTLQLKLSKRAIRCIRCRRFDVTDSETTLEKIFANIHDRKSPLWLGAGVCHAIMGRQRDYLQYPQTVIDSVQYAYMTHFYASAVSLFLDLDLNSKDIPEDHFEALSNLPSFMQYAENLLSSSKGAGSRVKQLLESNKLLLEVTQLQIKAGQKAMADIVDAAGFLHWLINSSGGAEQVSKSDVVLQALSGTLLDSLRHRNLLLTLRRANSDTLARLLAHVDNFVATDIRSNIETLQTRLSTLVAEQDSGIPLRSEADIQNSSLRTTVVSRKIELSKAKTTLTKADTDYSNILSDYIATLQEYFSSTLIDPKSLPFHEIFLFDLNSPHRNVFTPRPRFAIERALSSPHDYLNCECCAPRDGEEDEESMLSSTQPSTAILYQLYLESGLLVNAADLRSAFAAIMGDKVENEEMLSVLFQRSLAELSNLGLVKGTKKRADHIIKLAWKGL